LKPSSAAQEIKLGICKGSPRKAVSAYHNSLLTSIKKIQYKAIGTGLEIPEILNLY